MTNLNFVSYVAPFFLEWKVIQENFVEKIKTHLVENCAIYDIMWKDIV
jgi:hypothetical protein